ncbi:MAG: RNA 2',3'-cyclic phosphodiesterase [Gammaproteobacteria bacterium]|nr:RNA 2',3'-cyclic phosphodiesterase [Gammaproteobacteria bacterium]
MSSNTATLFFALWPDRRLRSELVSVQQRLNARGKPVAAELLHMTLAYLGPISHERIPDLERVAEDLVMPDCGLVLDRIGWFSRARVGWLGSSEDPLQLGEFRHSLLHGIKRLNVTPDARPWKPHITLYRDLRMLPGKIEFKPLEWAPCQFCLVESIRSENLVRYRKIGRW